MLGAGRSTSHKYVFFLEGFGSTPPPKKKMKDNQPGSILYQAAFTKLLYSDIFHIDTYNNKKLNELLSIYNKKPHPFEQILEHFFQKSLDF